MKRLKLISFGLLGFLLLILTVATILEKVAGTDFVNTCIYSSFPFVLLWGIAALSSFLYIIRRKLQRQLTTFLLHLSFFVILTGAFTTWLWGEQGTLRLRQGEESSIFVDKDRKNHTLPFSVTLNGFEVIYYKGTRAPMDYVSQLSVATEYDDQAVKGRASMNQIFSYRNYRFYQSGYDEDGQGTILSVSHDPYGIGITYTGYGLLLLTIVLFFFNPHSQFRQLIKNPLLRNGSVLCLLFAALTLTTSCQTSTSKEQPKVLPREAAAKFGDLHILYNNRICPLQTLARDFTIKLYGKPTYRGLTAEQVLTGWLFYYDDWKEEPMIRIKSAEACRLMGIKNSYASLKDYVSNMNEYKLEPALRQIHSGEPVADSRGIEEANEKFDIVNLVCTGTLIKIFPCRTTDGSLLEWYSQSNRLPHDMDNEKATFIRQAMSYVNEMIVVKKYAEFDHVVDKIKQYQQKECGDLLPTNNEFKAEKLYNSLGYTRLIAIVCISIGLLAFIYYCHCMVARRKVHSAVHTILNCSLAFIFIYLSIAIGLRGYISNHLPLSNGFETMQFMAWCTLALTLLLQRKFSIAVPFGFLLCGLSLMVSMLGESNPQITQLMPVLVSPLLCIHVVVIMIAYSLLAFVMLNGVTAVVMHYSRKDCHTEISRLQVVNQLILYPAVFLLTIGIFIGAVWANVSWGRYWGWDPKEVWALITMLVYAMVLHPVSLPFFRHPLFFHLFCIVAFLTVLVTYFGVNFLLGGMHSYANG